MAEAADERRASGEKGALLGLPIGLKDLICTKGILTTCGSKILANFIPPYDATVTTRLRKAGAVFLVAVASGAGQARGGREIVVNATALGIGVALGDFCSKIDSSLPLPVR